MSETPAANRRVTRDELVDFATYKDSRPTTRKDAIAAKNARRVHVGNVLKMGNVGQTYFPQYVWGADGRRSRQHHTLVSGQEDPRTLTIGHTIHLNLVHPVRFAEDYLNYHRVFEAVGGQGGLSGFAHAAGGLPGT